MRTGGRTNPSGTDMKPQTEQMPCSPKLTITEYIGAQMTLHRQGRLYKGRCPFCGKAAFLVDGAAERFGCTACGSGGDLMAFIQQTRKVGQAEAAQLLATFARRKAERIRRETLCQAADFYHQQLCTNPNAAMAGAALRDLGLDSSTAGRLTIGFHDAHFQTLRRYAAATGMHHDTLKALHCVRTTNGKDFDAMRNSIIVPLRNPAGDVVGFDAYLFHKKCWCPYPDTEDFTRTTQLYGLYLAAQSGRETVLVVADYADYFRLVQRGVTNVVFPYGAELTDAQAKLLRQSFQRVLLWLPRGLSRNSCWAACRRCGLPCAELPLSDCNTPSEYLRKYGSETIEVQIQRGENKPPRR